MLKAGRSPLYYVQVLSLDICAGVVGSGAFAQDVLHAAMKPVWWFLLPASVWVVYTADHLMDARKVGAKAVNVRHKFHFEHFSLLAGLMLTVAVLCAVLAFVFLREIVFAGGLVMGTLACFHVLIAYWGKIRFGKEISVAVIYACGVWFAPFLNRGVTVTAQHGIAFAFFLFAALLNLFMNSVLEFSLDRREGQVFGLRLGPQRTIRKAVIAGSVLAVAVLPALAALGRIRWAHSGYLAVLCAVPGVILLFEDSFRKKQRYRVPAEWVFALGLMYL